MELEWRKRRFEKGRGHGGKNNTSEETGENARNLKKFKHGAQPTPTAKQLGVKVERTMKIQEDSLGLHVIKG